MTEMQKRFCENFLVCGNATQAMIEAGYSQRSSRCYMTKLLKSPDVLAYLETKKSERIAGADEVLAFLTAVMRGEEGDFYSVKSNGEVSLVRRPPTLKERISAASMLGKRYALFTERISIEEAPKVVFSEVDIPE